MPAFTPPSGFGKATGLNDVIGGGMTRGEAIDFAMRPGFGKTTIMRLINAAASSEQYAAWKRNAIAETESLLRAGFSALHLKADLHLYSEGCTFIQKQAAKRTREGGAR